MQSIASLSTGHLSTGILYAYFKRRGREYDRRRRRRPTRHAAAARRQGSLLAWLVGSIGGQEAAADRTSMHACMGPDWSELSVFSWAPPARRPSSPFPHGDQNIPRGSDGGVTVTH